MTLRELWWMAEAKMEWDWRHTSEHMALHCNIHRDTDKFPRGFTPDQFNPFRRPQHQHAVPKADISVLKCFVR